MPTTRRTVDDRRLADLLAFQSGVATRPQLVDVGCSDSWIRARVRSGRWRRVFPRVYAATAGGLAYESRVWAAVLYAGDDARASHDTAGHLARLLDHPPAVVHVVVPVTRRVAPVRGLVIHRVCDIAHRPRVGNPPRSRNEDTVLDLVAAAPDEAAMVALVTAALQRRVTTRRMLRSAAELRERLRGRPLLAALLADDADGVHSVLEWRYLRDVERAHGLPRAARQQKVLLGGTRVFRDVPYAGFGVVVELDGRLWHAGTAFRDMSRDNATAERGEVTLRYGYDAVVGSPCEVAMQVARVLRKRGWANALRRCGPGCRVAAPRKPRYAETRRRSRAVRFHLARGVTA